MTLDVQGTDRLRVACLIPGRLTSAFAEGLFQYLTLLVHGLTDNTVQLSLVVSDDSMSAFHQWRNYLPITQQANVIIITGPNDITIDIYEDNIGASGKIWLQNFDAKIDVWLLIRPDIASLLSTDKPIVSIFADFVFAAYPTLFTDPNYSVEQAYRATTRMAGVTTMYICFSDYVKKNHIIKFFDIEESRIKVVPHAPFNYEQLTGKVIHNKFDAARKIREYLKNGESWRELDQSQQLTEFLQLYPFEEVEFAFISTRARPHKNASLIVKAAAEIRKTYRNMIFIVTAPVRWVKSPDYFSQAIVDAGLQRIILSVTDLPIDIHAAFYKCAAVTVHPSPFEGGFPFTAFESVSSGTPILIADGPVAREFLVEEDRPDFLFDPLSHRELAKRIISAVDNRPNLVERQRDVLGRFPRTLYQNSTDIFALCRQVADGKPFGISKADLGLYDFGLGSAIDKGAKGWWPAEPWGRWASENHASLRLWFPSEGAAVTLQLELRCPPWAKSRSFTGHITIEGDGRVYQFECGTSVNHVTVSIDCAQSGTVEISIHSHELARPSENDPNSSDQRALGFGLERIRVCEQLRSDTALNS